MVVIVIVLVLINFIWQVLKFLEYIYGLLAKLAIPDAEKSRVTEIVHTEIQKWLDMLVDNVDIGADDAVKYFILLRTNLRPAQLAKLSKVKVTARVSLYFVWCVHTV